jgi:hypothetical protein
MEAKTGKPVSDIKIADLQALPHATDLKYAPLTSRLGGRLDRHLKHLTDDEAADLLERGDRFLADTPDEPARDQR